MLGNKAWVIVGVSVHQKAVWMGLRSRICAGTFIRTRLRKPFLCGPGFLHGGSLTSKQKLMPQSTELYGVALRFSLIESNCEKPSQIYSVIEKVLVATKVYVDQRVHIFVVV